MSLLDLVESNKAALPEWGATEEDIAEARALVAVSDASLGKRDSTKTGQEGERESVDAMFVRADRMLKKQIDRLVRRLRRKNPQFRAEYDAAWERVGWGPSQARKYTRTLCRTIEITKLRYPIPLRSHSIKSICVGTPQ